MDSFIIAKILLYAILNPQIDMISFDCTLSKYMDEAKASSPACIETDIVEHSRHYANILV